MHAWEAIQKTLDSIEAHIGEELLIEELADMAALSLFYYQRLFTRLVKIPVREYIKLRRLARSCDALSNKRNRILDVAIDYGFGSHETFTRAFKDAYGITPAQYREKPVGLQHFYKPDLLLNYVMVDEGVPLISDGLVLEMNRKTLAEPVFFLGLKGHFPFQMGRMLGERTGVNVPEEICNRFFRERRSIPHIPGGRTIGVTYHGDAPEGYSSYFIGAEADAVVDDPRFDSWVLPAREYVVCRYEVENQERMEDFMGKAMKFTRFWLKKHGLIADGFFPEMFDHSSSDTVCMELWIPFRQRT